MPKTVLVKIDQLKEDFPTLKFEESDDFYYSAKNKTIFFNNEALGTEIGFIQLLHEIGHALEGHHTFQSGVELVKMESQAWSRAKKIAGEYGLEIPDSLIEQCLDSYRDWLHGRSTCPNCKNTGVESDIGQYHCFNCQQKWVVPLHQRSRCYRLKQKSTR